jgi:hypothetical protein
MDVPAPCFNAGAVVLHDIYFAHIHFRNAANPQRGISTSLAVWLNDNPLARGKIVTRTRLLIPFTKEALILGGIYDFIKIDDGKIYANKKRKRNVTRILNLSSDEVNECVKRAEFIGKWFARTTFIC